MTWYDGVSYNYHKIAIEENLSPSYFYKMYELSRVKWDLLNSYEVEPKLALLRLREDIISLRNRMSNIYYYIKEEKSLSIVGFNRYVKSIYQDDICSFKNITKTIYIVSTNKVRANTVFNYRKFQKHFLGYVLESKFKLSEKVEVFLIESVSRKNLNNILIIIDGNLKYSIELDNQIIIHINKVDITKIDHNHKYYDYKDIPKYSICLS